MGEYRECTKCGSLIDHGAEACRFCKTRAPLASMVTKQELNQPRKRDKSSNNPSFMTKKFGLLPFIGVLMIIGGIVAVIYFVAFFDTSVEAPTTEILGQTIGGGRVNNIGLMNDRSNGIMIGIGTAIFGLILSVFTKSKSEK